MTAASILQSTSANPNPQRHIVTFCRTIDSLLGGGFAQSEVTELCGIPSIGKTQLAMQLCVDAKLPRTYGGVQGEAIYVDSEGSFSPERCWSMADALVKHVHASASRRRSRGNRNSAAAAGGGGGGGVPDWFTPSQILDGIHVFRVHDEPSQNCTIHYLEEFMKRRKMECEEEEKNGVEDGKKIAPIKLVVIDSIAFHYRSSMSGTDYKARTRSLSEIASFLSHLATTFDIAVVVINQMTTKVGSAGGSDAMMGGAGGGNGNNSAVDLNNESTKLVPALGESWAHATTTRLLLDFMPSGSRCCRLVKSPHKAAGTALYDVTENGIRDVPPSSMPRQRVDIATDASKRSRTHY